MHRITNRQAAPGYSQRARLLQQNDQDDPCRRSQNQLLSSQIMRLLLKKFQPCIAWEVGWGGNAIWQKETWSNLQSRDVSKNLAMGRRPLPRLQQDNWTSSTLLSCHHVMLLKQLPIWQQLSARVKLNPYCICFGILKETTFLLIFKKWSYLRNPLLTKSKRLEVSHCLLCVIEISLFSTWMMKSPWNWW